MPRPPTVKCYQQFPERGITKTPIKGSIIGETAYYWILSFAGKEGSYRANKGACSDPSRPYKQPATRKRTRAVEPPETNTSARKAASQDAGHKRSRNRKNRR